MRLLDFSPWQSLETTIPVSSSSSTSNSDLPRMVQRIIAQPRNQKRIQTHSNKVDRNRLLKTAQVGKSELIPAMILTTRFHLSVLGRKRESGEDSPLVEIPEWIYSTKPSPSCAFLSSVKEKSMHYSVPFVAPVVDAQRRVVYALQSNNHTIVAWALDRDAGGPDTNDGHVPIHQFHVPVVSLDLVPDRRRIRIKASNNAYTWVDVIGGITGLLANGEMFFAFHSSASDDISGLSKFMVGTFQESDGIKGPRSNKTESKTLLLSVIGYTSSSLEQDGGVAREKGRKRKSSDLEDDHSSDFGDVGEIVIFTLAVDYSTDALVLSRHTVDMSSLIWSQQTDNSATERSSNTTTIASPGLKFTGKYIVQSNVLYLQQKHIRNIFATQLDATHVSLVYKTPGSASGREQWLCSLLDIRRESLFPHPFCLLDPLKESGRIIKVVGISSALIAVLSDDAMIKICDVRRAVIVNIIQMQKLPGYGTYIEGNDTDLTSDWHTGSLCILMHPCKGIESKYQSIVCTSKIRLQEGDFASSDGSNRALKGSYNLASILASSIISSKNIDVLTKPQSCVLRDIRTIHPTLHSPTGVNGDYTSRLDIDQQIRCLENLRPGKIKTESNSETFSKVYHQIVHGSLSIRGSNPKEQKQLIPHKNGLNGIHHKNDIGSSAKGVSHGNIISSLINTAASVAVDRILSPKIVETELIDSLSTLLEIFETGQVSARIAFASNNVSHCCLRDLLIKLNRGEQSRKSVVKVICCIIQWCPDSLSESMLVILVDFILCHLTESQILDSFDDMKAIHHPTDGHQLFNRLKLTNDIDCEASARNTPKPLVSLQNRAVLHLKLSLIGSVVSYSHCNATLLRAALRRDLRHADKGEISVLFRLLATLLRHGNGSPEDCKTRRSWTMSASCWLAALIDSHLGSCVSLTSAGKSLHSSIEAVQKDISLTIAQGEAAATLNDILDYFDPNMPRNRPKNNSSLILSNASNVSTPDYCIEPLIF